MDNLQKKTISEYSFVNFLQYKMRPLRHLQMEENEQFKQIMQIDN